ncbi:hypothetical protein QCA50_020094 [Cerrena zonata]|uniref:Uncharacterized protein n=1 Tax=Cerrena zonata TaxID=2478898 RepID=A0AAW0F9S9_9APHY
MSYQPSTQHNYPPANESIPHRGIHGEYNSAPNGTQTDANWNSAAGAGNDPAHHHLGTATGAHSGNFTGAQGHPTHNNQYPPNADNMGQPGHNEAFYSGAPQTSTYDHTGPHSQHPTGEVMGASASVGPNMSAGPPPGTGTGAPGLGTGAGTHQVDPTLW